VSTPDVVPEGGTFIEATYGNSAGRRTYKLYIPSGYRGQAIPLIVMLHGGTQSPHDFAAGTRGEFVIDTIGFIEHPCSSAITFMRVQGNAAVIVSATGARTTVAGSPATPWSG
jgi:hypothetical protein